MKAKSILLKLMLIPIMLLSLVGITQNSTSSHIEKEIAYNAPEVNITMRDIANFLLPKKEHYPFSDEFIEKYQQKSGGYIDNAKKAGLIVDKRLHEPNQKWHFFESWLYPTIEEGMSWEESAQSRVYTKLLCPELLLWIYEACEVSPEKVRDAKLVAEAGKSAGTAVTSIASQMRKVVSWNDLTPAIYRFMSEDDTLYKVSSVYSPEYRIIDLLRHEYYFNDTVTFNVEVLNKDKTIDKVLVNGNRIFFNGESYSFMMPKSDAIIEVILKDKIKATSVTLTPSNLELKVGEENKILTAVVEPSSTSDVPSFTVLEGKDNITLDIEDNIAHVNAVKEGTATVEVRYNETVSATANIVVLPKDPINNEITSSKYNIKYDLGTRTTAKRLETSEDIFNAFIEETDNKLLTNISDFDYIYGGGNGGSNENKWYSGDMLKIGTTSYNGYLTFNFTQEINKVIIEGYIHHSSCDIRIGDSTSSYWINEEEDNLTKVVDLESMNVASLETVGGNNTSSVEVSIEPTTSIKLSTITKKPLYITSITFIYE